MITSTLKAISKSAADTLRHWQTLAIFAGLYALLLASLYGFIATREATIVQVLLTLIFVGLAPLFFFLLQSAIINNARLGRIEWGRVLGDSTKLALATLPVIALGIALMWLLNRWQAHFPTPYFNPHALTAPGNPVSPTPPFHWPTVLFATLRAFLFVILLPLALIHLWLEVAGQNTLAIFRGGASAFGKRLGQILARALATPAVLTYSLGLIGFALIPYVLLFFRITANGTKTEFALFILRLLLVFLFSLVGWIITLSALTKNGERQLPAAPAPVGDDPNPTRSERLRESELSVVS